MEKKLTVNGGRYIADSEGYRLPTEAGRILCRGAVSYAGSNFIDRVAWNRLNSGWNSSVDRKKPMVLVCMI